MAKAILLDKLANAIHILLMRLNIKHPELIIKPSVFAIVVQRRKPSSNPKQPTWCDR